jgi:hypothetical protein
MTSPLPPPPEGEALVRLRVASKDIRFAQAADIQTALNLISRQAAELERMREALRRQTENMAFALNHMPIPTSWYQKFARELEEDRARLALEPKE